MSPAEVEPTTDPDGFWAEIPDIQGEWGFGETPGEALDDLRSGLRDWLEIRASMPQPGIPVLGGVSVGM